jgi:zinc transporter 1
MGFGNTGSDFEPLIEIENPKLVLYTGAAGLIVNLLGMFLFHGHGHMHHHHHNEDDNSSDEDVPSNGIPIHPAESYASMVSAVREQKRAIKVANGPYEEESDIISESSKSMHSETIPLVVDSTVVHMPRQRTDSHTSSAHKQDHSHEHAGHHHHHHEGASNMHGIFLHVLGDALGSVGVIVSALFIVYTDYSWRYLVDPIAR